MESKEHFSIPLKLMLEYKPELSKLWLTSFPKGCPDKMFPDICWKTEELKTGEVRLKDDAEPFREKLLTHQIENHFPWLFRDIIDLFKKIVEEDAKVWGMGERKSLGYQFPTFLRLGDIVFRPRCLGIWDITRESENYKKIGTWKNGELSLSVRLDKRFSALMDWMIRFMICPRDKRPYTAFLKWTHYSLWSQAKKDTSGIYNGHTRFYRWDERIVERMCMMEKDQILAVGETVIKHTSEKNHERKTVL